MHRSKTEVHCPSCNDKFNNGAGLIQHIESGRCGQKEGQGLSDHEIFRFQFSRAKVHWDMQQIQMALPERAYASTIAPTGSSIDGSESHGGVSIPTQSLLDDTEADDDTTIASSNQTAAGSMAVLARNRGHTPGKPNAYEWPTITGKRGEALDDNDDKIATDSAWGQGASKALFPNAASTPAPQDWRPPGSLDLFSEREVIDPVTQEKTKVLELEIQANTIDGRFNCPFKNCE